MDENYSIFQNLATNENQMTEVLNNFLHFRTFRDTFLQTFLPEINHKLISTEDLSTQQRFDNIQPDLIISNDSVELFFEIKVGDAPLQDTQTDNYINHLRNLKKTTALCFIIPADYHELERITKVANLRDIHIINWRDIINLIVEREFDKSSQLFNEYLKLLKYWFEPIKVSFSIQKLKIMYDKQVPEIMLDLFNIIEQIQKKLSKRPVIISRAKTSYEHGFYVKDQEGNQLFFFGVWYDLWKDTNSPLCLAVDPDRILNKYLLRFDEIYADMEVYEGWKFMKIKESDLTDEPIKNITKKLEDLIDKILK